MYLGPTRSTQQGGYARYAGEAEYPEYWNPHLVGLFAPRTGPTGTQLFDLSRLKLHGTLTNMEQTDWSPTPSGDYGLTFGGADEYVAGQSSLEYNLTTNITVCADVRFTSSTVDQGIVMRGSPSVFGGAGNRWFFYSNDVSAFSLGSKIAVTTFSSARAAVTNSTNTDYRVVASFDNNAPGGGANKWKYYINGVDVGVTLGSDNGAFASVNQPLDIGRIGFGSGGSPGYTAYLIGPLRELAIYGYTMPPELALRWSAGASGLTLATRGVGRAVSPPPPPASPPYVVGGGVGSASAVIGG